MTILVIGASSYVGARIYTHLKEHGYEVVGTYHKHALFPELRQLDITQAPAVTALVREIKPQYIIHLAANAGVPACDADPAGAVQINEHGTRAIVDAANAVGAQVIFASTDAVYGNTVYAKTKRAGEQMVQQTKAGYVILRLSMAVGVSPNMTTDRIFNRILKSIRGKKPTTYDTSFKTRVTWLRQLCETIEEIIAHNIKNEHLVVSTKEVVDKYLVARDLCARFGIEAIPEDRKQVNPGVIDNVIVKRNIKKYTYEQMIDGLEEEVRSYLASLQ